MFLQNIPGIQGSQTGNTFICTVYYMQSVTQNSLIYLYIILRCMCTTAKMNKYLQSFTKHISQTLINNFFLVEQK